MLHSLHSPLDSSLDDSENYHHSIARAEEISSANVGLAFRALEATAPLLQRRQLELAL